MAGGCFTKHECVSRIDVRDGGLGPIDDLGCFARDEIDNLGRAERGKLDLFAQRLKKSRGCAAVRHSASRAVTAKVLEAGTAKADVSDPGESQHIGIAPTGDDLRDPT